MTVFWVVSMRVSKIPSAYQMVEQKRLELSTLTLPV